MHGVAVNDSNYITDYFIGDERFRCPKYQAWAGMITRCYSPKLHKRNPTYSDCSVCGEWLYFSSFKLWMVTQKWQGMQLDKDILKFGNKIYSPETCMFVPPEINTLISHQDKSRGELPMGVSLNKENTYRASCSVKGKKKYIGSFKTVSEAQNAYKVFKANHIKAISEDQEPAIKQALTKYVQDYLLT